MSFAKRHAGEFQQRVFNKYLTVPNPIVEIAQLKGNTNRRLTPSRTDLQWFVFRKVPQ